MIYLGGGASCVLRSCDHFTPTALASGYLTFQRKLAGLS